MIKLGPLKLQHFYKALSFVVLSLCVLSFQNCANSFKEIADNRSLESLAGVDAGQDPEVLPPATPTPPPVLTPEDSTALIPETKPAKEPSAVQVSNPNAVTTVSTNPGQTTVLRADATMAAGFKHEKWGNNNTDIWRMTEAGAWLEYDIDVPVTSGYGFAFEYSTGGAGIILDLYIDGVLVGKRELVDTRKNSENEDRTPVIFLQMTKGRHKVKVISGPQDIPFALYGLEVNAPGDKLVNFGKIQTLSMTSKTILQQDAVIDFYRLPMSTIAGEKSWACVWTFCFVEFLVFTEKAAKFDVVIDFSEVNYACAGYSVNGLSQGEVEMVPTSRDSGQTKAKTVTIPAGVNRFRISNTNYYNNRFCYGANFAKLTLSPSTQ